MTKLGPSRSSRRPGRAGRPGLSDARRPLASTTSAMAARRRPTEVIPRLEAVTEGSGAARMSSPRRT